ncbi:MAG: hypothetical protein WCF18_06890 [Chthoniobacteraceae bacterium]
MKTLLPAGLLFLSALFLSACANEPPRDASGRKLKLETIHRPHRAPIYQYRPAE